MNQLKTVNKDRNMGMGAMKSPATTTPSITLNPEIVRLNPVVELVIVGGLGMLVVVAPTVADFMKQKFLFVRSRVVIVKDNICQSQTFKTLQMLNRRRKTGSIVRVIGSVLPSWLFTPPRRIYIPSWVHKLPKHNTWNILLDHDLVNETKKIDPPSENLLEDGLIEAFEIGSEITGTTEDEDDDDNASSSPEGWIQEQREFVVNFDPTLNATETSYARCSTPVGSRQALHFDATRASQHGGSSSRIYEDQTDITELKKMVEGLMLQINCLNQSLITTQTQLVAQNTNGFRDSTTQNSQVQQNNSVLPPPVPTMTYAGVVANQPKSVTPPPPPPPPPMPPMVSAGNKPLVITKNGSQDKLLDKKPQMSLTDVLKELPNAKLRRIERSPGGTPVKHQLDKADDKPLDIGSQLASALKKRFESMHSPVCEVDTDKENLNSSNDSFDEENPSKSCGNKRILFPVRSPLKRSSGGNIQCNDNRAPFGQHILKKRNVLENAIAVSALRKN